MITRPSAEGTSADDRCMLALESFSSLVAVRNPLRLLRARPRRGSAVAVSEGEHPQDGREDGPDQRGGVLLHRLRLRRVGRLGARVFPPAAAHQVAAGDARAREGVWRVRGCASKTSVANERACGWNVVSAARERRHRFASDSRTTFGGAERSRGVCFFRIFPYGQSVRPGVFFRGSAERRFVPSVRDCASKRFRPRTRGNF